MKKLLAIIILILLLSVSCGKNAATSVNEILPESEVRELYAGFLESEFADKSDHGKVLYAVSLIDLDGNGCEELIVFLTPNESDFTVDVYTVESGEVKCFTRTDGEILPSVNARDGSFSALTPSYFERTMDSGLPLGFFASGDRWMLRSHIASEFKQVNRIYVFESKNGFLDAQEIFSSERDGDVFRTQQDKCYINGEAVDEETYEREVKSLGELFPDGVRFDNRYLEGLESFDSPGEEAARRLREK